MNLSTLHPCPLAAPTGLCLCAMYICADVRTIIAKGLTGWLSRCSSWPPAPCQLCGRASGQALRSRPSSPALCQFFALFAAPRYFAFEREGPFALPFLPWLKVRTRSTRQGGGWGAGRAALEILFFFLVLNSKAAALTPVSSHPGFGATLSHRALGSRLTSGEQPQARGRCLAMPAHLPFCTGFCTEEWYLHGGRGYLARCFCKRGRISARITCSEQESNDARPQVISVCPPDGPMPREVLRELSVRHSRLLCQLHPLLGPLQHPDDLTRRRVRRLRIEADKAGPIEYVQSRVPYYGDRLLTQPFPAASPPPTHPR